MNTVNQDPRLQLCSLVEKMNSRDVAELVEIVFHLTKPKRPLTDQVKALADQTGLTISFWQAVTHGISKEAFDEICGNLASLPKGLKSIDSPLVSSKLIF